MTVGDLIEELKKQNPDKETLMFVTTHDHRIYLLGISGVMAQPPTPLHTEAIVITSELPRV